MEMTHSSNSIVILVMSTRLERTQGFLTKDAKNVNLKKFRNVLKLSNAKLKAQEYDFFYSKLNNGKTLICKMGMQSYKMRCN